MKFEKFEKSLGLIIFTFHTRLKELNGKFNHSASLTNEILLNQPIDRNEYLFVRNKVISMIKLAKKTLYFNCNYGRETRGTWRYVNELRGNTN